METRLREAELVPHFLRRITIRDQVWRYGIGALTLIFGLFGGAIVISPDGAGDSPWRRSVVGVLVLTVIPVAIIAAKTPLGPVWWMKRSPSRLNVAFVAYADIGLGAVVLSVRHTEASLIGTGLFAVIGAYVAHFVSGRVMAFHIVFSSAVIGAIGVRLLVAGHPPLTVGIEVVVALVVANALVALLRRYTLEMQAMMRRQLIESATDPLTTVLNRRGFTFWSNVLVRGARGGLLVAAVDVDSFKTINDRFGHAVGDEILKGVAELLGTGTTSETVVARLGGDEFAVVSVEASDDAAFLIDAIHWEPIRLPDGNLVSLSIGIATTTLNDAWIDTRRASRLLDDMHELADRALASSKAAGRGQTTSRALEGEP